MRTDFDKQWERRKAWRGRCPLDDAELRRRVLRAQVAASPFPQPSTFNTRRWLPAAAAACLLAVLLPLGLRKPTTSRDVARVNVGGTSFLFVCNCDCPPDETVAQINRMIK